MGKQGVAPQKLEDGLEQALLRLLKKMPFEKISIAQLVAEAGCARSSFYNYYEDIYDFMNTVIEKKIDDFYKGCKAFSEGSDTAKISVYSEEIVSYIEANKVFFQTIILDEILACQLNNSYLKRVRARNSVFPQHSIPTDVPDSCVLLYREFWHVGVVSLIKTYIQNDTNVKAEDFVKTMVFLAKKLFG